MKRKANISITKCKRINNVHNKCRSRIDFLIHMQRTLDIFLSSVAILIISPLFIVIMIILRFTGEGEVFYRQQRVGRYGKTFGVFKFATMVKNSSKIGTGYITTRK